MALRCIEHLMQEHRLILRAVYVLRAMAGYAEENRIPPSEDVDHLIKFFRRFADDHHQGTEEAVLFPALRRLATDQSSRPLHQMLFEHDQERSLVEGIEDSLHTRNASDFAYYGRRLADILATHIYKEDHILFDLAEKLIDRDVDLRLVTEMTHFDAGLYPNTFNEMSRLVNALERKYLGKAA